MKRIPFLVVITLSLAAPAGRAYLASPVAVPGAQGAPPATETVTTPVRTANADTPGSAKEKRASRRSSYLRSLLPFVLIGAGISAALVAAVLGVFLLRRRRARAVAPSFALEQIGYCAVGNGEAGIGVVRAANSCFLVGITPHQVSLLAPLPGLPVNETVTEAEASGSSFGAAVEKELRRMKTAAAPAV